HNNAIYGLTTGQTSPTSMRGMKTKSTPHGVLEEPIHPLALAIVSDATFVARGYSGNIPQLTEIFVQAITHKGFAHVDVLQACPSWNKVNTPEWFKGRIYDLAKEGHDPTNKEKALEKALEDVNSNYERIPTGIFYRVEKPTYEDGSPQMKDMPLARQDISRIDMSKTLSKFY
ncbi:MAG: thiamine pyrophosphate-dependent enzyme, partial [Candidatus Micrarchaeia archaeon]